MSCDLIKLANPGVSTLQPYQPGKPMEELERELGLKYIIKLASNENPLGPGKLAMAVLQNPGDISRYPDGNCFHLKSLLSRHHGVRPEQITVGNGSNEILELVARAVLASEHEVIFSEHAFAVYPLVTQAVGATSVVVPARNRGHDPAGFIKAVTDRTRLVFIANPNNPTGTWLPADVLGELIAAIPANVIVVLDEAYYEYATDKNYPNGIEWLEQFPNLLVTRTFSKVHGLAGMRIGYGVSSEPLADLLNRVRQPFNVNSLAQAMAAAALGDSAHIETSLRLNAEGMQQLISGFNRLGLEYIPSAGNFICVDLQRSGEAIYKKLLHEGVIVRPVANYGLPNHLRITVGLPEENEKFLQALEKVLSK